MAETAAAPGAAPPSTPGDEFEAKLPEGQRWLNRFCENWIFAFLVAMAIRHFALEAFRIPTASMEPMLFGDPGFLKGDHVVVDKLLFRFRGVHRWDVTVFQFPEPELESGDSARPAIDEDGHHLDVPLIRPLMYRNFVKRCVVMPGDRFYIFGGNLYLEQPDKSWQAARKPADVQEALFRYSEIYRHGAQPGYVPWQGRGGATATADGDRLAFTLPEGGEVEFTQPLRNLYLKPGAVGVRKFPDGVPKRVEASMIAPQFQYEGEVGNIWDMATWEVRRLTSADLDSGSVTKGTVLNAYQNELVGDVRLQATIVKLSGRVALIIAQGQLQGARLTLSESGWSLDGMGQLSAHAEGTGSPAGKALSFMHLDDQYVVALDGHEVARVDCASADPNLQRLRISVAGAGALELREPRMQRDVHYTKNYVLKNASDELAGYDATLRNPNASSEERDHYTALKNDVAKVRLEFGCPDGVSEWACSPQTAATAPPGAYLLLGDNSPTSWDGRAWGWVPAANLRGRAIAVVLPFGRWRIVR